MRNRRSPACWMGGRTFTTCSNYLSVSADVGWKGNPQEGPQRILEARGRALTHGAMRKSILFTFLFSACAVWLPTASSACDKEHNPESVLVSVEGCLKMS